MLSNPNLLGLIVLLAAFSTGASSLADSHNDPSSFNDTLSWEPCVQYPAPFQCSRFQVPLDYANPSIGSVTLALIRLPASTSPRSGYMFYNPGGPGGSGVGFVGMQGPALQARLGSGWDILSWDPRGVGASGPDTTLFDTPEEYDAFYNQLQGPGKYEAHGNATQPSDIAFFRSQTPAFDSLVQQFDEKYRAKSGTMLKYIGSCAGVRDLVGMVDAIYGPRADINFYGISYGTILAAYLIEMFPHRVGKVIADGVLDALNWSNAPIMNAFPADLKDTEAALRGWSAACASSSNCNLAALGNGTTDGVARIIDSVLDTAYKTYDGTVWSRLALMLNGTMPSDIHAWSYDSVASILFGMLSSSQNWHALDGILSFLYTSQNNITSSSIASRSEPTPLLPFLKSVSPGWGIPNQWSGVSDAWSQTVYAIACGDSQNTPSNYTTSTVFDIAIRASQTVSSHFGTVKSPKWFCHRWTTRAVERLNGKFDKRPKNVVLVIGNSLDPITPYAGAKAMAAKKRLGKMARLVQFNAIGHFSGSNNSTCIDDVVRAYANGDTPVDKGDDGPDVVCEVSSTPFSS